ncbi:MAG: 2-C-methyl-D-erythritol 2,4-cyclodiphosphate synthase [Gemmatimonadetes bacterium]|jgi:2-C-methyl-D-erythritol 4-phosphate cytidylyltransferase / 2-C-methyl-D-erythritol 2,4-cyclodiphosphate synthase|nr:2-C-methyl-D-erythritol 2,4-cyclodiphosphate synthase [Gemmatimonadota bacterium]MBT6143990.1 2-C-methyl-D-erythritol 2,4-cyclodiphosphate synthase [Gemmatimonadota bacterium]MBT7859657.1 2-C-methyl-D-erythritol 2,4-cyclodiphosphate synthase [Gemmatimonadota bacterium]
MGGEIPKQYMMVDGRPLLAHTLEALCACDRIHAILVAIHPDDEQRFSAIAKWGGSKLRPPVTGGAERVDSVERALACLEPADDIILVHDAVRPWVSDRLIGDVVDAATLHGAAIAAVPVTETVKQVVDGVISATPDRRQLMNAQTPQGFRRSLLQEAFARRDPQLPATDEAVLVEACGHPVHVVEGEYANVKVTIPQDLPAMAPSLLRIGQGYDVHAFAVGRPLILGGIQIPADRGLAGHSDADVLTHAIIDALLGAVAMGDVGQLFPDTDESYAGISSLILLKDVADRLQAIGARVVNIDTVVMAQAPKLAPHTGAIARRLAETLGIDEAVVSVKATTTERLGFVGREEGMAAQAVALVQICPPSR